MPTPPKPFEVLSSEGKSHRTKNELNQRKQEEAALLSGTKIKERSEVKNNQIAHNEFTRINKLLKKIKKNDALYEVIINRYCIILAECFELEERRDQIFNLVLELKNTFNEITMEYENKERASLLIEFSRQMALLTNQMMNIDAMIQTKRKMLLEIEKENIFTIAAALCSIPKKEEKKEQSGMAAMLAKRQAK
jgi:hypothetical protein